MTSNAFLASFFILMLCAHNAKSLTTTLTGICEVSLNLNYNGPAGNVTGVVRFSQVEGEDLEVRTSLSGFNVTHLEAEPLKGFHVHEIGDISGGCETTGGHYRGTYGDLPNLEPDQTDGTVDQVMTVPAMSMFSPYSILDKALVVHSAVSGPRLSCCLIKQVSECPIQFDKVGDRCLIFFQDPKPFAEARENCTSLGAGLTTPMTKLLYKTLMAWMKTHDATRETTIWLGLSNIGQEDKTTYVWEDAGRTVLSSGNWSSFRNNRGRPTTKTWEKCVTGRARAPKMRGFPCRNRSFPFVCEIKL